MQSFFKLHKLDLPLTFGIVLLICLSILILYSLSPYLFPLYLIYIVIGIIAFLVFVRIDFEVISLFSRHLYIASIFLLLLPLLIGQVTRGAVRWIPLGPLTLQPAELVRPFLLVFFANYLIGSEINFKKLIRALMLLALPVFLIYIQPSLGVAVLTLVAFFGVFLSSTFAKRKIFIVLLLVVIFIPVFFKLLAPYQQKRIISFLNPSLDPYGAGYNSIQSIIAIGSGKIFGRGLGRGVQTQLAFLPEKQTDFIFAAISEELGFVGSFLLITGSFFILFRLTSFLKAPVSPYSRAYLSGLVLVLLVQTIVNIGMNLGLLPITGIPLPLVSAGGSSFLATMISLAIAIRAYK